MDGIEKAEEGGEVKTKDDLIREAIEFLDDETGEDSIQNARWALEQALTRKEEQSS